MFLANEKRPDRERRKVEKLEGDRGVRDRGTESYREKGGRIEAKQREQRTGHHGRRGKGIVSYERSGKKKDNGLR